MALLDNAIWLTGTGGTAATGNTTITEAGEPVIPPTFNGVQL